VYLENALRLTAGIVILLVTLAGVLLGKLDTIYSLLYFFISLNLIQSAFTDWCPVKMFYEKVLKLKKNC